MKFTNSITPDQFKNFQTENMDAGLSVIGVDLSKFEKRKQVAARLLGYNSYESINFENDEYHKKADIGEMLVARHHLLAYHIVFVTNCCVTVLDQRSGETYFIEQDGLSISDITSDLIKSAYSFECDLPFEPNYIELDFSGVKTYNIGIHRIDPLYLNFDWHMHNELIGSFKIKVETTFEEKPNSNLTSYKINKTIISGSDCNSPTEEFLDAKFHKKTKVSNKGITEEMVLWKIHKTKADMDPWDYAIHTTAEKLECTYGIFTPHSLLQRPQSDVF